MTFLIIGGGIIGAAIARELARRGVSVTLLEAGAAVAQEASGAAVGTLSYSASAPMSAGWHTLASQSMAAHHALRDALTQEIPNAPLWHFRGRFNVATTNAAEKNARDRLKADLARGMSGEWLDKAAIHAREPALAPAVQGGSFREGQGWVDAPALTRALVESACAAGATLITSFRVTQLLWEQQRVVGVADAEGRTVRGDGVIIAAGAWSGAVDERVSLPLTPVRGQAITVALDGEPPIEHLISGNGIYMIPDAEGVTIGATHEEVGFQRGVTVGGVGRLLQNALVLVPALGKGDYARLKAWSGFRPATPDKTPVVSADPRAEGLWWATGHFRSGVLLAPITANLLANAILNGDPLPDALSAARLIEGN
jgi:glycine oxidase